MLRLLREEDRQQARALAALDGDVQAGVWFVRIAGELDHHFRSTY